MKTERNIPEAVVKIVREGKAPKGKTFVTAATAMCFGAPDAFHDLNRTLSTPLGVEVFKTLQRDDFQVAMESLCVLSMSASYALCEEVGTLQAILVPKDAPSDVEFVTSGPDAFAKYMGMQEARKSLLHEIVSAYFHETGHALTAEACGAAPHIRIHFKPIGTEVGVALTAEHFGCAAERNSKPDDEEQAVLTLGGVMYELLGPLHKSLAPLTDHLLTAPDFWIKLLQTATGSESPDEGAELTRSAELVCKTLYGAGADARAFFKYAPTHDLQVAATNRTAAILRPLMDKDGEGCTTFADTTLAAINHFMTLDAINNDLRKVMARYENVPTFGVHGDKAQREHAEVIKKEATEELAAEAKATEEKTNE